MRIAPLAGPSRLRGAAVRTRATSRVLESATTPAPSRSSHSLRYASTRPRSCFVSPVSGFVRRYASEASPSPSASHARIPLPEIGIEDTYDIVIIGGANAGLALGCALLSQPSLKATSRILLLEGGSLDRTRGWDGQGDWENRVSSLTAENVAWLDSIGAWQHIQQDRTCPVNEMIVWANPSPKSTPTLHFPPLGFPMAHMTENQNLQSALYKRIRELDPSSSTLHFREQSRVSDMQLGEGGRWVGLQLGGPSGQWVRGSVVIGADGPNSPVRKFSDIDTYGHAYELHAIVATLHHSPQPYPNTTAFQRFLPTGPIAFLPLSGEASTLVWYNPPHLTAALKKLSPAALTSMVNAAFSLSEGSLAALSQAILSSPEPLSDIQITEEILALPSEFSQDQLLPPRVERVDSKSIASFPIRMSHADVYLGDRTVLVGDAAHTIHPLAGQGLNMGLADVRSLAETLETARRTGGDLGSKTALAPYPRERYVQNHLLLSATDKLNAIFKARGGLVDLVRGTGLEVLNELGPIKKLLMANAGAQPRSSSRIRTEREREFGRANAADESNPSVQGWPMTAANALEGWWGLKSILGMVGGAAKDLTREGLRRTADALERR